APATRPRHRVAPFARLRALMMSPATEQLREARAYERGMRSSLVGLGVNLGLATVKLIAGLVGTSYALVADAIESLGDAIGSIIVWRGLKIASRPPDHN